MLNPLPPSLWNAVCATLIFGVRELIRLMAAFETSIAEDRIFTDEAGLFEALGWEVIVVPGSYSNIKITSPGDLAMAEALMTMGPGTTTQSGVSRTNLSGLGR